MVRSSTMPSPNPHDKVKNTWKRDWARNKTVYLVFVPVAIYIIVTHYLPMFGIVMAFQDFSLSKGVFGSTFVGPDNFVELFTGDAFLNAFKNTAIMAAFSLVLGFFPGLIFALMLSEVRNKTFKRTIQMISYLPNFVAAVVVTNLVKLFLGNDGPLTALLTALGLPPAELAGQCQSACVLADSYLHGHLAEPGLRLNPPHVRHCQYQRGYCRGCRHRRRHPDAAHPEKSPFPASRRFSVCPLC